MAQLRTEWARARQLHPRLVPIAAAVVAVVAALPLVFGIWFLTTLGSGLPDKEAFRRIGEMDQATAVFDASDRLVFTIFQEQRIEVPLSEISPNLVRALIDIEDQRFYEHHGFDIIRIGAAALANLRRHRAAQGGSTLTQQLARQSFLRPDKTMRRKAQELILAKRIERQYSKQQILELYLNKVYFGDGLYGAEAASRGYFGVHASELSVPQAALLAGLVKSPSSYAPTVSMERAVARRNVVLQTMLDAGDIDRAAFTAARTSKVALHDTLREAEPHGEYFKEQVRRELVDRFGWQRVYQGGLKVYTTIDMRMQLAAETAVDESLKALDERRAALAVRRAKARATATKGFVGPIAPPSDGEPLQAALVAMDPATGHIRAMVGGRDFNTSSFNRVVQAKRQPGSAFKPFVYAAALEAGYSPATLIDHLDEPTATMQGAWMPADGHSTASALTMRAALRTSSNRAAVRMLQEVGISRTVEQARTLGVGDVPSVPSLALGSGEVTVQSLTAAYAAFANHGLVPGPLVIRHVDDQDGLVLYESQESSTRAISDVTAFLMSSMLADVINAGTGASARRFGFSLPAAGKTGTTNDFNDAWFVGYTPTLVAGVWVGFDQPRTILPNGFAADVAVPVWAKFMKAATRGAKPEWFPTPAGVTTATVCRLSGKLASDGCQDVETVDDHGQLERRSLVYTEYFSRGSEPTAICDMHPTRGLMATFANLFGAGEAPAPAHVEEAAPSMPTATTGVRTEKLTTPDQQKKRRSFWSRIFGRGGDEREDPNNPKKRDPE
jgi:1A family penicillin-binding protein